MTDAGLRNGNNWTKTVVKAEIGSDVSSIGSMAFYLCSGLSSVTIGNGVTSIGTSAFQDCTSLTAFIFKGKTRAEVDAMDNHYWGVNSDYIITQN